MQRHLLTKFPIEDRLGPGCYVILFRLERKVSTEIGKRGFVEFKRGWYAYVGSARLGISGRLGHHLRASHSKPRWHLDYLLPLGIVKAVVAIETDEQIECTLANSLSEGFDVLKGFGASDCKCEGHLFYSNSYRRLLSGVTVSATP